MEINPPDSALSFPAASKHVAILSIVFKTEPLSLFVEFFVLTDLPIAVFLKLYLLRSLQEYELSTEDWMV